jgi:hypothetical protein
LAGGQKVPVEIGIDRRQRVEENCIQTYESVALVQAIKFEAKA